MRFLKRFLGSLFVVAALTGCSDINIGGPGENTCSANDDCTEGKTCRIGSCANGACSYEIMADWCFVDGSCFQPGQELPGDRCQTCDPTLIQSGLVNKKCPEGQQCNSATGECVEPPEDIVEPDGTTSDATEDAGPSDTQEDTSEDAASDTSEDTTKPDLPPVPGVTCGEYCEAYLQLCGGVAEFVDMDHCLSHCNTFAAIPAGTADDTEGNTLGCRLSKLKDGLSPDFEGDVGQICLLAGSSGGNVCGTWCENYCHLAIKNCSGQDGYFETFNECKSACNQFPADGDVGDKSGDTVQCRIYHLGAAGDPESGGSDLHCPHGSVAGTGGCEPKEEDLCTLYCQAFEQTCPVEVLGGEAYLDFNDCLIKCSQVPQDGQDGDSMGYSVQCLSYHVAEAASGQSQKHCINAVVGNGSVCIEGPSLKISEIAPYHVNPLTGASVPYVEILNQSNEMYLPGIEILIGTSGMTKGGEVTGFVFVPLDGLDALGPGQRVVIVSGGGGIGGPGGGGGALPVPPGTLVISADLDLSKSAGIVALLTANGYFEVVTFGGPETEVSWSNYFEQAAWDYMGKPAPAAEPGYSLSRCPEDQDTDDGSDFKLTGLTLAEPNQCNEKDDKEMPLPGG